MTESTSVMLHELRTALSGAYDIEAPLGRGGMAFVYLARERRLDRPVAIKVLAPELADDETSRKRFLREARTVAQLAHPNIVPIFTVDEIGGFVFFAMAYVAGETLAHRVATRGPLDPHEAGRLLCDVGEALDYAHARGVVHRDVKPDNILIDEATGRALLSDFGIAHASPPSRSSGGRQLGRPAAPRGHVIGTAAFMSPEQASAELVDARSDIYSLGVVAYYALSGRLPFQANTDEGFLAQHISDPAPKLATVVPPPMVPPRLAQIVDRCLSKEPWARYPDAAAMVRAVTAAVAPPAVPLAIRLPVVVAVVRVRRLLAAGHKREELVAALAARQARRREELAFVYGPAPTSFERFIAWLARLALLTTSVAVGGLLDIINVPWLVAPLLPFITAGGAATALLAAVVARARTEQRTDPRGERTLRFWRGPLGRALFRVADPAGARPVTRVASIVGRVETPA